MHIPIDLDLPRVGTSSDGGGGFGGAAGVCASATDVRHAIKAQRMEGAILIVQAPGSGGNGSFGGMVHFWRPSPGVKITSMSRKIQRENVARYPPYSGLNLMPLTTVRLRSSEPDLDQQRGKSNRNCQLIHYETATPESYASGGRT
jgi:hypothetical protein